MTNTRATAYCLDCGEIKTFEEMDWIECNREGECKACKQLPLRTRFSSKDKIAQVN
jgi:NAD-dependent SIR2 family protein deacetylase